jgi:IS30 family transposase
MVWRSWTEQEQTAFWGRYRAGASLRSISRALGYSMGVLRTVMQATGGRQPVVPRRSARCLSLAEREEISRGIVAGQSSRTIAERIGRAPSTVSRELARNGGLDGYRACRADRLAWNRARRPKPAKLATHAALRVLVETGLQLRWSPQQIAGWLRRAYPGERERWVSHETIYLSLFVQSRGALRKELTGYLRTRRMVRRPHAGKGIAGQGQLRNAVNISARPAEVADRAVPGHWEGDLLLGGKNSAIATLVERTSRFTLLVRLPNGRSSEPVLTALAECIATLPRQLVRSLTWDQGKEMAQHAQFTIDTGLQIYFCDPSSPWQRGTNENTNGLLRQYYPKGTDLTDVSQDELDAVAAELNGRPRQTLAWWSPSEKFAEAVATTA